MRKIAIVNKKGGVGKTATTVNLASVLSNEFKRKVLVVDCDGQCDTTAYLTTSNRIEVEHTLIDCLQGLPVKDALTHITFATPKKDFKTNIDLLAAENNVGYIQIESDEEYSAIRSILEPLGSEYDYCLFDCPPNLSSFVKCVMCASDYVIIPAILDTDSLRGFGNIIEAVNEIKSRGLNYDIEILGILYTFVMINMNMDKLCKAMFDQGFDGLPFEAYIRNGMQTMKQARHMSLPLDIYKPIDYKKKPKLLETTVTGDYIRLAKEIEKRIIKMEGKRV